MKKLFLALALTTFVGSMATSSYAAVTGVKTEKKDDDKRKKRKKKKGGCCASKQEQGKSCCAKKATN
jgi:hypothetical protein